MGRFRAIPYAKALLSVVQQEGPQRLEDVVGQEHLLAADAPLGAMLAAGQLSSMVLWGPPGVGKTTIASLLADAYDLAFVQISAIFTGVPELRKVFEVGGGAIKVR